MKILVFGEIGQVGQELQRRCGSTELEVRGLEEADFTDPDSCRSFIAQTTADAVINAVAYTAVDKAEEDVALATQINATTPGVMASAAAQRGLPFVQISTDYVFDGSGETPFEVDAPTAPLGVYGLTKRDGEVAVRAAGGPHAVLRTSWVFSAHGQNFVKTMLRLGAERDRLTIVADQIGGPTAAADIADACLSIAEQLVADSGKTGTYHFSGTPDTSWAGFAREIFRQSGVACDVEDIPTSAYPTPATRPLNSRLDCSLTASTFGIQRPDWRNGLHNILDELGALAT